MLTLLSGPAAGVLGGAWAGALSGGAQPDHVRHGRAPRPTSASSTDGGFAEATARDTWIGGYPVLVPMIDIHTIGAGGGSIAYVDDGGAFRVGPHSAGAEPGPAGYGRGGTEPTVTDANLVLGRLDPDHFLGGAMPLDRRRRRQVVGGLAERLGLSLEEAAEGILTIVNANMANAISSRTVQKGLDPREFALVAFGGAGPLHGAEVARAARHPRGDRSGLSRDHLGRRALDHRPQIRPGAHRLPGRGQRRLERLNRGLSPRCRRRLEASFAADGVRPGRMLRFERSGDLRYVGQGYELRVPFGEGRSTLATRRTCSTHFREQHRASTATSFATARSRSSTSA